jgi:hypothetical protein
MKGFDLEQFRVGQRVRTSSGLDTRRNRKLGSKRAEFLKGPIPWDWLCKAGCLPGKSLHVALSLWFLAGVRKSRVVKVSYKLLRRLGAKRDAARRGLAQLESGGLVKVQRQPGRSPVVEIVLTTTG